VPEALRAAGADVRVHDDLFPSDARDVDWLQAAGAAGWVVLTKDQHIRINRLERGRLLAAGVKAFVLTAGEVSGPEMASLFVGALAAITRLARRTGPGFIATVSKTGHVRLILPEKSRRG